MENTTEAPTTEAPTTEAPTTEVPSNEFTPEALKELELLLDREIKEVETNSRVYVSSKTYGDSRFHMISKKYDCVQIEETKIDDKWGSRIQLQKDEIPEVLITLIRWYLEEKRLERKAADNTPDDLGELDDHPF